MKHFFLLMLATAAIFFAACEDDNNGACDKVESLGSFSLLDASKADLPYQSTDSRVIFSDSLGQEHALNLIPLADGFATQEFLAACSTDSTTLSTYEWERERICYELEDEAALSFSYQICVEVEYNVTVPQEKRVADLLSIEAYSSSSRLQREGDYAILLSARNFAGSIETPGELELLDEFSWEGRTLTQVYRLENINNIGEARELYYTKSEGLVAFRDYASDVFYFFERIE